MSKLQLSALLLCVILGAVSADYILTVHLPSLYNPAQVLANGDCCVPNNQSSCTSPCNTTLRICIREGGHDPNNLSCPLKELIVAGESDGSWSTVFTGNWVGSLQLYVTVIHDLTATLGPLSPGNPVIGDLIDLIFIEQLTLSPSDIQTAPLNYTGQFNKATVELSFSLTCTFEFYGALCDVPCPLARNDSLGHYRCDENGTRVCLEGYSDMESNCTVCVPLEGCSEVGGYCMYPGECICRHGYNGPTCFDNATIPTPTITTMTPTTSSSSINQSTPLPNSLSMVDSFTIANSMPDTILSTVGLSTPSSSISVLPSITNIVRSVTRVKDVPGSTRSTSNSLEVSPTATTLSMSTRLPSSSPTSPNVGPILPSPPPADTLNIILGVVLGVLLLMIVSSLAVFVIALALTYYKKHKRREEKRRVQLELRSRFVDVVYNMAATGNDRPHTLDNGSHSDLEQSHDEHVGTYTNPTYSTFQNDSGTYTQETLLDEAESVVSNRGAALEAENNGKRNLAELEKSVELSFHDMDTSEDLSIGDDLLGSIRLSLSQAGTNKLSVSHSTSNDNMESIELGSDYAPSFIYADIFDESAKHEDEFRTPSLSPDSVHTLVS